MHAMQVKRVAFGTANACGCRRKAASRAARLLWRPDDAISRQSRGHARGFEAFSHNVKHPGKERVPIAQRVVTTVISATDIPYSFYVPYPRTPLHDVDARVKQLWVIAVCVMFPFLNDAARVGFALWLAGVTMALIPYRTWWPQLKGLAFLCGVSMLFTMTGADGVKANFQSRIPPAGFGLDLPPLPPTAYRFELLNIFFIVVTRKSVNLAVMAGTLIFSTLQATSLCLVTTPPEQLARGLRWFMTPLEIVKFPVKEFEMVLLLSLRFVSVVFTELRNLCLGLAARGVNWRALGTIGVFDVMINLMSRLFSNLLAQCSTMAEAMCAMGFTTPEEQKLYLLSKHRGSAVATLICAALLVAFCCLPVLLKLL